MVGIVVVSHSEPLARAAVDLALEMVSDEPPVIRIAAGANGGFTGTDAVAIAHAIDEVATPSGVLVLMDLGSAVLSAEMARDLLTTDAPVQLSNGPFVEGLLAAVVLAGAGAPLATIAREAEGALALKRRQLRSSVTEPAESVATDRDQADTIASFEATVIDPAGLHARPAAALVRATRRFDANVQLMNLTAGTGPAPADSLLSIMGLGVSAGTRIRVTVTGRKAIEAAAEIERLIDSDFADADSSVASVKTDGQGR